MEEQFETLKKKWGMDSEPLENTSRDLAIERFTHKYNVILPLDMLAYFKNFNGAQDNNMFEFFCIEDVKPLGEKFKDSKDGGLPDYKKLLDTFKQKNEIFVFADYFIALHSYGIKLENKDTSGSAVYVFCGEEYKVIAHSFTEFIQLYIDDSIMLYL